MNTLMKLITNQARQSLAIVIIVAFILSSCGGNSYPENEHLGKLPGIAQKTMNKLKGLQGDMKDAQKNMDVKAYKKAEEKAKEIKEKAEAEMTAVFEAKGGLEIPFEQQADKDLFMVKSVKATGAHFGKREARLDLELTFEPVVDIPRTAFTYLRFVDKKGAEIKGWAVLMLMSSRNKPITAGETYIMKGSYLGISNLMDVDKVLIKSREEWESKKRN